MDHPTASTLESGLDDVRAAPGDDGRVALVVRRPAVGEREVVTEAELDPASGLVGDTWEDRPSRSRPDGSPHPDMQLTLMSVRVARLVAGDPDRVPLAGDQLYVDLDLSEANLPAGSRLQIGSAVVEVTAEPHRGCQKFTQRFGLAALRFVNSEAGGALRLRGANAKVVRGGTVRTGDPIRKVA
ncbi:MAG TPA: MOSC domain-containing protein [Acidimicrobiia bacterium]